MTFKHLEYVVEAAHSGSISRASQRLLVSQPYLSGMIRDLERELGIQIFQRGPRGITLTQSGEALVASARRILQEREKILAISRESEEPLQIASCFIPYVMSCFLRFKSENPCDLPDKIREIGNNEIFEALSEGAYRLGLISFVTLKREKYLEMARRCHCQCTDLFSGIPMGVMTAQDHPLAGRTSVAVAELQNYPYVVYDDESSLACLNILHLEHHPAVLAVSARAGLNDAVRSGGYLTATAITPWKRKDGFAYIPFADQSLTYTVAYATRRESRLSRRESAFLKYLREQYPEKS